MDPVDVFLLHNEREPRIEEIVDGLRNRGLTVHFWRTDIAPGQDWRQVEEELLQSAASVVVVLGQSGWGPSQSQLLNEAIAAGRRLVPVLVGGEAEVPVGDMEQGGGLFRRLRYLPLRSDSWEEDLGALVATLPRAAPQHAMVAPLLRGDDDARSQVIDRIVRGRISEPQRLKSDLVSLLEGRLAPDRESARYAQEADQPSVQRGWVLVALVFLAFDDPRVVELVSRHLEPVVEPENSVRFWLLDAVAGRDAERGQAAARRMAEDPAADVRWLAQILLHVEPDFLLPRLRAELRSKSPGAVLQALRASPVPDLLPDLVGLLNRDQHLLPVCNALTQRVPPDVALDYLSETFSDTSIAQHFVVAGSRGNRAARRRFARLLLAMGPEKARSALTSISEMDPSLQGVVREFRGYWSDDGDGAVRRIPGYSSDTILDTPDYLDINRDVEALTAVMLARDLSPPLAIGLFGAWGSGKSFFMEAMREATTRLRVEHAGDKGPFCREVVEIKFNAWHYADGALWASLVSHIIDCLTTHVTPRPTEADQNSDLSCQLESARTRSSELENRRTAALALIAEKETRLAALTLQRQNAATRLDQFKLADLRSVLKDNTELKTELQKALANLGAPTAATDVETLDAAVRETHALGGRVLAFLRAFASVKGALLLAVLVGIVVIFPAIASSLATLINPDWAAITRTATGGLTLVAGSAAALRRGLHIVSENFGKLEKAKADIDAKIADRRETPSAEEVAVEQELAHLRGEEESVAVEVRSAELVVSNLQQALAALREKGSLRGFLADRSGSDDYRKHLGVMATVRADFEALTERLAKPPSEGGRSVERIVLYIDDLDRCPAEKVVEVLEAVHLLLAFPLFVVVVGVDPRWLTDSLNTRHAETLMAADRGGGHATARDFLEKIFQIPIALRPMTDQGFARLMAGLMHGETRSSARIPLANSPLTTREVSPTVTVDRPHTASTTGAPSDLAPLLAPGEAPVTQSAESPTSLDVSMLILTEAERRFAETLHPFFSTPRAAKRFVNTYRLLKAQVEPEDRAAFEDEGEVGGFKTVMVMLALEISANRGSAALQEVLRAVAERRIKTRTDFRRRVGELDVDQARSEMVRSLVPEVEGASPLEAIRSWWPMVMRYSFSPTG